MSLASTQSGLGEVASGGGVQRLQVAGQFRLKYHCLHLVSFSRNVTSGQYPESLSLHDGGSGGGGNGNGGGGGGGEGDGGGGEGDGGGGGGGGDGLGGGGDGDGGDGDGEAGTPVQPVPQQVLKLREHAFLVHMVETEFTVRVVQPAGHEMQLVPEQLAVKPHGSELVQPPLHSI